MAKKQLKIALLFGGPSLERGISLNSARSIADHLESERFSILPIYFDQKKRPYQISRYQLYSNTPSDFDFKLSETARPLSERALGELLKSADLAFPIIHGEFGEDGKIQFLLEKLGVPFVGPSSQTCKLAFDKYEANERIREAGFYAPKSLLIKKTDKNIKQKISNFLKANKIKKAVVKPAAGGSSIGVYLVRNLEQALLSTKSIFKEKIDKRVVLEPFCKGTEFTVVLFENRFSQAVAAIPSEIELENSSKEIFDYRKKYLANKRVTYHCPPRFSSEVIRKIQIQAEQLYHYFGFTDFSRFDGWLLDNGEIWFSDFNPLSGMEQNSFLFMQAARLGFSHRDALEHIVANACRRYDIALPALKKSASKKKKTVNVLFGGKTAEKQVSLMSGTNVWLKLKKSKKYDPVPYFLDDKGSVWQLPYAFALNHSVEEVAGMCKRAAREEKKLRCLQEEVLSRLATRELSAKWSLPTKMSLGAFVKNSKRVFIALHGGIGEDGSLQKMLERSSVYFNGPGSKASRICSDKYMTGKLVSSLADRGIYTALKKKEKVVSFKKFSTSDYNKYFKKLQANLDTNSVIVKPIDDGCSAGIAKLKSGKDLKVYISYANKASSFIPDGKLEDQHGIIEMPESQLKTILFEAFIETDQTFVKNNKLFWKTKTNWIEVTVGLLEENKKLRALSPSITIAGGSVLSLEEKFQGGTGVNITPPPAPYVSKSAIRKAKARIEIIAEHLGIRGYSRLDAFMHKKTGEIILIEANTLPGLTASTVIYHQALAEKQPLVPHVFLEKLIQAGERR